MTDVLGGLVGLVQDKCSSKHNILVPKNNLAGDPGVLVPVLPCFTLVPGRTRVLQLS
jgi:hypothetical protein